MNQRRSKSSEHTMGILPILVALVLVAAVFVLVKTVVGGAVESFTKNLEDAVSVQTTGVQ